MQQLKDDGKIEKAVFSLYFCRTPGCDSASMTIGGYYEEYLKSPGELAVAKLSSD